MSIERRKNNCSSLWITTALILTNCSSVPVKQQEALCSGKSAKQKIVWTISFSQQIEKGMGLAKVSEFFRNRTDLQEHVSDSFVPALLFLSSNDGQYSRNSSAAKNDGLSSHAFYLAGANSNFLYETSDQHFTFCEGGNCPDLKDPFTNKTVGPISSVDWRKYFQGHPFPAGNFISDNYFVVPDSMKGSLCEKAGFEGDCFDLPKFDFHNDYIPPDKCNIQDGRCLRDFSLQSPFRFQFLFARNGLCGTRCFDDITSMIRKLKEDPYLRMAWEDAIAKDVFLKLSIVITRKVEKDWVISRIEFNPELFCRYAQSNSDLISQ